MAGSSGHPPQNTGWPGSHCSGPMTLHTKKRMSVNCVNHRSTCKCIYKCIHVHVYGIHVHVYGIHVHVYIHVYKTILYSSTWWGGDSFLLHENSSLHLFPSYLAHFQSYIHNYIYIIYIYTCIILYRYIHLIIIAEWKVTPVPIMSRLSLL